MTQPSTESPAVPPFVPPPPPMPVQPLAYGTPERGRPGVLTAVGVLSIVFGSLGLLGALGTAASVAVMQVMATSVSTTTTTGNTTTVQSGTTVTTAPGVAVLGGFQQSWGSTLLQLAEAFVRAALAGLLAVAAICVFRDHPLGRKLHLTWAYLRIPAALVAAVLQWWMMNEMMAAMPPMPPAPGIGGGMFSWISLVSAVMTLLFAWAYPIAVLIVMNTRTVKAYYDAGLGARPG